MVRLKRQELAADARRINRELLARLGGEVKASRLRRRWTQHQLALRAGLSRQLVGRIERGDGGGVTLDGWQRVMLALGRPLRLDIARDPHAAPADAGHLDGQELMLRLLRGSGFIRRVELNTKPADSRHAIDVVSLDPCRRVMVVIGIWNVFTDLGSAARGFDRELAAAAEAAAATGIHDARISGCWAVIDSAQTAP